MYGIGIDTGGTYTDAVIYDFASNEVLCARKALTTKYDLKVGIQEVLQKIPTKLLASCQSLSLSTTLATNACVEGRGGKGKLIFIGLSENIFADTYKDYGIDSLEDIYLLSCTITPKKSTSTEPDWIRFRQDLYEFKGQCDCVSLVQLFAREHHGAYEKKAAEIVAEVLQVPTILGHELFMDLNIVRRGAGALLNARLIPVIHEFLCAIKNVFHLFHLDLPPIIVRSDGSLMSEEYTCSHPVETLLCGPAASIIGAMELSSQPENALIVDMGGTTTDIAIVEHGIPKKVESGIQIGDWKTFVKGLFIDTFALGGDTAVHYNFDGDFYLEKYRIIPLCVLASSYPYVVTQLHELNSRVSGHTYPLHEFFVLVRNISKNPNYSDEEQLFCKALEHGPLILDKAAKAIGKDIYSLHMERLEKDGIVLRSGLTPTDIMHIEGDFQEFNAEASREAAKFVGQYSGKTIEDVSAIIYDLVQEKLYCNLVRILMEHEFPAMSRLYPKTNFQDFIHLTYEQAKQGTPSFFSATYQTQAILIGVGAPTHIFLPQVAKMLGTTAHLPMHASVANAVGAISGNVSATATVEIIPFYEEETCLKYELRDADSSTFFDTYEEALALASQTAMELALKKVKRQGAVSGITTTLHNHRREADTRLGAIFLSEKISVTATGKVS